MLDDCYILGRFMNFRPRMLTLHEWDGLVPRATQITEDNSFSARRRIILSQPVSRWINFRYIKVHSLLTRKDRLGTNTVRQRSARFKDEHYLCYIFPFFSSLSRSHLRFRPLAFLAKVVLNVASGCLPQLLSWYDATRSFVLISFNDVCGAQREIQNRSWCDKRATSRQRSGSLDVR